jgi:microsomal dipeptidase-like Zn-dependent dipeptidase
MLDTIDSNQTWEQLKLETINIKVDLSIITHDAVSEHPFVNISLNGFPQFGQICEKDTVIEIDAEIEDNTENFLTIEYHNKNAKQDVVLDENGMPIADKRVEINRISIDDIELEFFHLTDSDTFKYEPTDPEGFAATGFNATKLAWNGKTTLRFTTPVYIWLLENL